MTKSEKSLLLFLETCCVDSRGLIKGERMNDEDHITAERWDKICFIQFGRVSARDLHKGFTHWCTLSDTAWSMAWKLRRERFERMVKAVGVERIGVRP